MPFPSPVDHILSDLFTMTCSSWVALQAWLGFTELEVQAAAAGWRTKHDQELPSLNQGEWPRVPGCDGAGTAGRSHPEPEARAGGREEHPEEWWL